MLTASDQVTVAMPPYLSAGTCCLLARVRIEVRPLAVGKRATAVEIDCSRYGLARVAILNISNHGTRPENLCGEKCEGLVPRSVARSFRLTFDLNCTLPMNAGVHNTGSNT